MHWLLSTLLNKLLVDKHGHGATVSQPTAIVAGSMLKMAGWFGSTCDSPEGTAKIGAALRGVLSVSVSAKKVTSYFLWDNALDY